MPIVVVDFDGIIAVNEQHRQFKRIHKMAIKNYISEEVVELAESTIEEHQELEEPESDLNYRDYLSVISTIDSYSSRMGDDIESAVDDFNDDVDYFDQNNFLRSLDRYLELYLQRVSDAENDKIARSAEKAEKRAFSGILMLAGFALILLIGIILLLFSIQNILKKNIDK
jgi:CHASE3 domain sensor protein